MNKTPLILALCLFCSTCISANCSSPCCATGCYVNNEAYEYCCDDPSCNCHPDETCSCLCDSNSEETTQTNSDGKNNRTTPTNGYVTAACLLLPAGAACLQNRQAIYAGMIEAVAKKYAQAKDSAAPFITGGQRIIGKILSDEQIQAALAHARSQISQANIYIKENPVKTALMTVGAGAVTYVAYTVAKALRIAYNCYRSIHTDFCICCGKKIGKKETKYATNKGFGLYQGRWQNYYCKNCHNHIEHDADNSLGARYKIRFGREFNWPAYEDRV